MLDNEYGKNNGEPALFLTDEATKLKENVVLLARVIVIALGIISQILLFSKERAAFGIAKLPVVRYKYIQTPTKREQLKVKETELVTKKNEITDLQNQIEITNLNGKIERLEPGSIDKLEKLQ